MLRPLKGKALAACDHKHSIVALEGSVRSGKTFASLIDWLDQCVRHGPEGDLVVTGKTRDTIIRNIIYPLQAWLGDRHVRLVRGVGEAHILGRRVFLIGGPNEGAETKLRGSTYGGAYLDEASTVPESFFAWLYSRLSLSGAQLWLTTNPETPAHWLLKDKEGNDAWLARPRLWIDRDGNRIEDPGGIDLVRISFKLEDNPNLPIEYVERIKKAYSGLWYRRMILGEWCIAAGAVYEEWDPERHVISELPEIQRVIAVGIDYGATNPTAGLLVGISAEQPARLVVLAEWAPERATNADLSRQFRVWLRSLPAEWQNPEWVIVDPSERSFRNQLFEDGFSNVHSGNNAVLKGIRTVGSLLSLGRLVVSEKCRHLLAEIPGYVWDPKATARGEDAPIKQNDHFCDALRYAVQTTRIIWRSYVPLSFDGGS